jgi:hypothetical protein
MQLKDIVNELADCNDHDLEYIAMLLHDADAGRALTLMRYIGIMDMESTHEQHKGELV